MSVSPWIVDISGEIANIHVRIDAKNLVSAARTIQLPAQKETIHMISKLRKEACSGSVHDLAPNPNLLGRLPHKGFSQSGQPDHSREDKKIAGC